MINISIITLKIVVFTFGILLHVIIINNYLGNKRKFYYLYFINKSYILMSFVLFTLIYLVLMLFSYSNNIYLIIINGDYFNIDLYNNMKSSDSNSIPSSSSINSKGQGSLTVHNVTGSVNYGTINVNDPKFRLSIHLQDVNNLEAAASSTCGVTAAIKAAQYIPGSPSVKLAVGGAVYSTAKNTTAVLSKVLNNNSNNIINDNNSSNFIGNIINDPYTHKLNDLYPDFPLNLLPEMNQLVNIEFIILLIFLNIFIVNIITNSNYIKYIPNNKFGKIFNLFINRYIKLWSKS